MTNSPKAQATAAKKTRTWEVPAACPIHRKHKRLLPETQEPRSNPDPTQIPSRCHPDLTRIQPTAEPEDPVPPGSREPVPSGSEQKTQGLRIRFHPAPGPPNSPKAPAHVYQKHKDYGPRFRVRRIRQPPVRTLHPLFKPH